MSRNEKSVILHHGVFKKPLSINNAIFMITGMTIGAGILGIPYVVAQIGLLPGILYIAVLGTIMLFFNLMIGEIVLRTKESFQLPGLVGKYLGKPAKILMSIVVVLGGLGTLLAYIIGEGQALAALLGGIPMWWSVVFWAIGSVLVWRGLQTIKTAEKIFSIIVIGIILGLSFSILPQLQTTNLVYFNFSNILIPFGVILFALNVSPSIAEAHALLPDDPEKFRKALILGTMIPIAVYILFALAVVGVMGKDVTQIATIGLSQKFGSVVGLLGNLFAVLAMGTGFMGLGVALKQSLIWDWKVSTFSSTLFVILVPLTLFMVGFNNFITILGVVGGLFMGIEVILMVLVYWIAKKAGDLPVAHDGLRYAGLFTALILTVFTIATVASIL